MIKLNRPLRPTLSLNPKLHPVAFPWLWLLALAVIGNAPVAAQEGAEHASTEREPAKQEAAQAGSEPDDPDEPDPCAAPDLEHDEWVDRVRSAVYRTVCGSAVWFDGFFGEELSFEEGESSYGRLGMSVQWDEFNGVKYRGTFKAKLALPRFENRVNAFVGRYDKEEFVADRPESFSGLPEIFEQQTDQEWLAGFGYNPLRSARSRLDFDAGVDLDTPIEPFVKARYRYNVFADDRSLLRLRQTLFWRNQVGYGTTTIVDLERLISERAHTRWRNIATFSETTEGVDWRSTLTFYHYLGGKRAFAYSVEIDGETDAAMPVKEYGLEALYRQGIRREWLFLEVRGRVFWPQEEPGGPRETTYGIGVGFEMLFGRHP